MNESRQLYILVKNASVISGTGIPPFIADIGIAANRRVRDGRRNAADADLRPPSTTSAICGRYGALRTIEATGMTVVPLASDAVDAGQIVDLPEWKNKHDATIGVGQPARLALLKPAAEPGKYQVELVLK